MSKHTSTLPLQLHLVPMGRRLAFVAAPGCHAAVYRRCHNQPWQCVAPNARSPYLDTASLPVGAVPEYVIRYRDAAGTVRDETSVVRAHPVGWPASPSWMNL